ncbi:MAG TPA: alpha-hydroxy acid oxidase [Steroidobacteraceae bacterium]|nr:alpha-hydroxy acid oxidase [Steroidobacteraceae bacterium]
MSSSDAVVAGRRGLLARLSALAGLAIAPRWSWSEGAPAASAIEQALNVMDFEALARAVLPPAHFAYIATGNDDDLTVVANHEAFKQIEIRSRRFVDVSKPDLSVNLLGVTHPSPVYLSALGSQRAFNPEGELATARAAASRSTLMMLSNAGTNSAEDVIRARGAPVWMQLYATDDWSVTQGVVKRAERAGCTAIILTVDYMEGRNGETLTRAVRTDTRVCTACHVDNNHDPVTKAPMYAGLDVSRVTELSPSNITWDYLKRLRDTVSVKLLVKGIVTGEDAAKCVTHGVDGVIISNHGGRDEETLRSTIECLAEVSAAVAGRTPVLLDGGLRRGTDVFKALALGATAVGIGRPQAWGLAAGGQKGVEAILDIYNRELRHIMRQAGTPGVKAITRDHVVSHLA